jgi:hypothetical protein
VDPNSPCSSKAACPTKCGPDEMSCWGGQDHEGCAMPDTCMPSKGTSDECPAECPTPSCGRNEMPCQDMSTNGCPSKGYCMPFEATSKCNAFCPVNCGPDEMHCPGAEDHMGCKMPDSCIPSKNGDCPAFCPVHCNENEMMCPGGVDGNGCPMPDECMHVDPNMRCSSKMMCPTKCGPDEMHCPGGMDYDGCPMPDTCVPSKTADGCPANCPVVCGKDEMMCSMMPDTNGCPSKGWCMHNDDTAICKNFCPPQCGPDDMVCPGGEDAMGCKIPDTCMPSKDTCPEV